MYYPTPTTVRKAWDRKTDLLASAAGCLGPKPEAINLSDIATAIIHDVGRFAERYASDFLINWRIVEMLTDHHAVEPFEDSIVLFGIRRNGVDCNSFFMNRCNGELHDNAFGYIHTSREYRRILAVRIAAEFDPGRPLWQPYGDSRVTVELKDLTDQFISLEDGDKDWTWNAEAERHASLLYGFVRENRDDLPANIAEGICDHADIYAEGNIPGERN